MGVAQRQPAQVELRIEELALIGFSDASPLVIAQAVEQELARLIRESSAGDWGKRAGEIERLEGGSFQATSLDSPRSVGKRIAQAIHRGMNL